MYLANASLSFLRLRFAKAFLHFNSCGAQLCQSAPSDKRVGIAHGRKNTLHTSGNDCVGARPGAPDMRARLEIQVERCAPSPLARLFQCQHFGMLLLFVGVYPATNDLAILGNQYRAHARVRGSQRYALAGELQRLLHELLVSRAFGSCSIEQRIHKILRS